MMYANHPAAEIFPMLPEHELRELAEDIRMHGLKCPVALFQNQIIDGRNRVAACRIAGVTPSFTVVSDITSPATYVLSTNLRRRHLSESQRAMVGARVKPLFEAEARERMLAGRGSDGSGGRGNHSANLRQGSDSDTTARTSPRTDSGKAAAQAAAALHVSPRSVEAAARVVERGVPELVAAVERGDVSVSAAAEVSKLRPQAQAAVVTKGPKAIVQEAAAVRATPAAVRETPTPPRTTGKLPVVNEHGDARIITLSAWDSMSPATREALISEAPTATTKGFNKQDSENKDDQEGNIEWARWSWNPVTGCKHTCPYCYARDIANRFYEQGFEPSFIPERLHSPRNVRPPKDADVGFKNVFVCSMADLFGQWVPSEWIQAILDEVTACPQWNFLFLTKFPKRLTEFKFPDNAWIGTSVDSQKRVANAEKAFRSVQAKVKWLSLEPLIEPLHFSDIGAWDWLVIGGASASSKTPAWRPPRAWVNAIEAEAERCGVQVYEKTNLLARKRGYPSSNWVEPSLAPEALVYL